MGLFEQDIAQGMRSAEFRRGWAEAEAELITYYASLRTPRIINAPEILLLVSSNTAPQETGINRNFTGVPYGAVLIGTTGDGVLV